MKKITQAKEELEKMMNKVENVAHEINSEELVRLGNEQLNLKDYSKALDFF